MDGISILNDSIGVLVRGNLKDGGCNLKAMTYDAVRKYLLDRQKISVDVLTHTVLNMQEEDPVYDTDWFGCLIDEWDVKEWLEAYDYSPKLPASFGTNIVAIQSVLHMTNVQFANYYGFKLRTVENWRKKPESCPDYVLRYVSILACRDYDYLHKVYGSEYVDPLFYPFPIDLCPAGQEGGDPL